MVVQEGVKRQEKQPLTGTVAKVKDEETLVINRGAKHGVQSDDKFLVYYLDDELFDPETSESLGRLEVVCGEGIVEHVQETMTTIKSSRMITKKQSTVNIFGIKTDNIIEDGVQPFVEVSVGCYVKRIN